jgi:hypothetical protein
MPPSLLISIILIFTGWIVSAIIGYEQDLRFEIRGHAHPDAPAVDPEPPEPTWMVEYEPEFKELREIAGG